MSEEKAIYETKEQTIFRIKKNQDNPYVMMDKRPIENDSLSWKAKGLLSYLLSRPDDWTVRIGDLVKRSTDGEYSTRAAIKELIDAGHLVRKQGRTKGAKFDNVTYDVYEKPLRGNPQADNPQADNLALSNKDLSKKELSNTTLSSEKQKANDFLEELNARKPEPKPKEERKPLEVAGMEWKVVAGLEITKEDQAVTAGETITSRLSGWYGIVPETEILIARTFAEGFGKLPPAAPKNKKDKAPFFYAWCEGTQTLLNTPGNGDLLQIIKSLGSEYDGFDGIVNPYSIRNQVYAKMNEVKHEAEYKTNNDGMLKLG